MEFFNGRWAILYTLCLIVIDSLIKKIIDDVEVYLECAHPGVLTTK